MFCSVSVVGLLLVTFLRIFMFRVICT
ncbi:hypothetical protein OIU77_013351 [Salix suchowensis]|uniref:Uncharacterized protein n=1 Tax=Salix suchowensis TaxID=1278906 RepID=A0ABQ8ZTK1_9ROSI|nr:hypothetical protein OIU77_013351 [Salix suchowensis]